MLTFLIVCLVVFLIVIYFIPTIIAIIRNHPNKLPIFIINLFLGFTLLGWVISLAWSCARISDNDTVKINEELRKQSEINNLKRGQWYDLDTCLLHSIFDELVNFVDR